jgi:hypothetical protein
MMPLNSAYETSWTSSIAMENASFKMKERTNHKNQTNLI